MGYTSLFNVAQGLDSRIFDFTDNQSQKFDLQGFTGTIGQAIDGTIGGVYRTLKLGTEETGAYGIMRLLLMNGRICRGILNSKTLLSSQDNEGYFDIINGFSEISFRLYKLDPDCLDALSDFSILLNGIIDSPISQKTDSESWIAMNPYFSNATTTKIENHIGREDYIFIALGHGGIVPGIDVYLRLKENTGERGTFYPIRFSRAKLKDKEPRIEKIYEMEQLRKVSLGKKIVIFDEDASSGNTLLRAEEYFRDNFLESAGVSIFSNIGKFGYNRHL